MRPYLLGAIGQKQSRNEDILYGTHALGLETANNPEASK